MEYLGKGDLQRYLAGSPPLPISQARQITFQLLEGLSAMHEQGFAHRDLKPGVCYSIRLTILYKLTVFRTFSYILSRRKSGGSRSQILG